MKHEVVIDGVAYVPAGTVASVAPETVPSVTVSSAFVAPLKVALEKADPTVPAFVVSGSTISLRSGVAVLLGEGVNTERLATPMIGSDVRLPELVPGSDYRIVCDLNGALRAVSSIDALDKAALAVLGGFHFAPGGCARERSGGDETPAINPHSVWDLAFRPRDADPSGMVHVANGVVPPFWCDIYLLAQDHKAGTSRFGATIADGYSPPEGHDDLNYATAKAVFAEHGKGLLSAVEFWAAAYGVTEATALGSDPVKTGVDAPRTSRFGIMQATGNMSTWGHDGDVEGPNRACWFGGSWDLGGYAGSRYAFVDDWPEDSNSDLSARGRSDHLQLA